MMRSVLFSFVLLVGFYGLVSGVRECYKCEGEDCHLIDTTIQKPCPHINNICFTVVDPNTCKVAVKGCAEEGVCDVYSKCETCDTDRCNSRVNFDCETEPCKVGH